MATELSSVAEGRSKTSSDLKTFLHYGHNVGSKEEEPLHQPTAIARFCTAKQHGKAEKETVDGGEI